MLGLRSAAGGVADLLSEGLVFHGDGLTYGGRGGRRSETDGLKCELIILGISYPPIETGWTWEGRRTIITFEGKVHQALCTEPITTSGPSIRPTD